MRHNIAEMARHVQTTHAYLESLCYRIVAIDKRGEDWYAAQTIELCMLESGFPSLASVVRNLPLCISGMTPFSPLVPRLLSPRSKQPKRLTSTHLLFLSDFPQQPDLIELFSPMLVCIDCLRCAHDAAHLQGGNAYVKGNIIESLYRHVCSHPSDVTRLLNSSLVAIWWCAGSVSVYSWWKRRRHD